MSRSPGLGTVTPVRGGFWARGPRPARISLGVHRTRELAEAARAVAVEELRAADKTHAPGVSLRAFGLRVLAEREQDLPRSRRPDAHRWGHITQAPWVDDPIDTITTPAINRWARDLLRKLPHTAVHIFSLLRVLFGEAVREGLAAVNPCASVRLRPPPRVHEPWTYLLLAEQRDILTCPAATEIELAAIGFALGTGLREGEQFNLRLADLHLDSDRPHVVVRRGSKMGATKSGKIRRVPLFGLGLAAARRQLEILPGHCPENPLGLVFPGPHGGYREAGHPLRIVRGGVKVNRFAEILTAAGIVAARRHDGRPVRWHDLRHSFAASLVSGWWGTTWRLEELRDVLGHSTILMTQRYAHLAADRVLDLAARTPGPGLHAGYTPMALGAEQSAFAAPIAPRSLLAPTLTKSSESSATSTACDARNPAVTREAAIEGLQALARGDVAAAERVALRLFVGGEPTSRRLAEAFEALLVERRERSA